MTAARDEVQGERPWSAGKIVLTVLGGIAVAAAVVVMTVMAHSS